MMRMPPIPKPPLDDSDNLGLDKTTPYATICAFGKNNYFAASALSQNGFDIVSVAGGLKVVPPRRRHRTFLKINKQQTQQTSP